MSQPILGYWDLRSWAEPIRYLLHYKNVDFRDKRCPFDKDSWPKDKCDFCLFFPNLPYYTDGNIKITGSTAILRYVARKYGLDGKDDKQKLRVSVAEQEVENLCLRLIFLVIRSDYDDNAKAEFVKKIPDLLKVWEKYIGDHKYLTGDTITYVDFMAYDAFDFYRLFHAEALDEFPKLKAFQNRIKSLPELQEYLSSSTYKKWPIFGPQAKFGGGGDPPKHL